MGLDKFGCGSSHCSPCCATARSYDGDVFASLWGIVALERGVQCIVEGDKMGHDIHIIPVYLRQEAKTILHNPPGAIMNIVVCMI